MTFRFAACLAVSAAALLAPLPALAQAPDFGDDTSVWANDGECDDPRFQGPGVAPSAVEADQMHDATDCRAAFEAGTATLIGGQAAQPAQTGGKGPQAVVPAQPAEPAQPAQPAAATGSINFGDDTSEWANDGECDDRRFVGAGMALSLGRANIGRDATDCRGLFEAGQIQLWDATAAAAVTQCAAIDFGADTSEFTNDGECDDMRFEGMGSAQALSSENNSRDATDCSQLCAYGAISLRDY